MRPQLRQLVEKLTERTTRGWQKWKHLSDRAFRTAVGEGLVSIERDSKDVAPPGEEPVYVDFIRLTVFGSHGKVVAEEDVFENESGQHLVVAELFDQARRSATNADQEIDEMLKALDTR